MRGAGVIFTSSEKQSWWMSRDVKSLYMDVLDFSEMSLLSILVKDFSVSEMIEA